jgi:hypothetical protein
MTGSLLSCGAQSGEHSGRQNCSWTDCCAPTISMNGQEWRQLYTYVRSVRCNVHAHCRQSYTIFKVGKVSTLAFSIYIFIIVRLWQNCWTNFRANNKHERPRAVTIVYISTKRQVQCACTITNVSTLACIIFFKALVKKIEWTVVWDCDKIVGKTGCCAPTISMNGQEWRQLYTYVWSVRCSACTNF